MLLRTNLAVVRILRGMTVGLGTFVLSKLQLRFKDRSAAGDVLADILKNRLWGTGDSKLKSELIVFGIPRGGVVTADRISRKLSADIDIIVGKKIAHPDDKERAIGAIMEDGTTFIHEKLVNQTYISQEYLEEEMSEANKEVRRRMEIYYGTADVRDHSIKGKAVILVDDGAATGATIIAAARSIRKQGPERLIIAVPVVPQPILRQLKAEADDVEVITSPSSSNFLTIEQFYQNFIQVTDDEVTEIIRNRRLMF
jgi:putative phosphoribosyl transferase